MTVSIVRAVRIRMNHRIGERQPTVEPSKIRLYMQEAELLTIEETNEVIAALSKAVVEAQK